MAAGSSLTGDTVLCPLARHIYPYLVLVQPMIRPHRTEKLLTGTQRIKPNKQTHCPEIICMSLSVICFSGINIFLYIYFGNTNVPSECPTNWIQIRYDKMLGLIWVQPFAKVISRRQTSLADPFCTGNT